MSSEYGTALVYRHADGIDLVDGLLVLDTAGEYEYRRVGPAVDDHRVLMFERVNA